MKRFYSALVAFLIIIIAGLSCVYAAEYTKFSSKFIKHFQDCDKYEETTTGTLEGNTYTTTRQILGWRNGFCKYQETMSSKDGKYQTNCSFTNVQLDELYSAMKNRSKEAEKFDLETFASVTDPTTGKTKFVSTGTITIKGNKAYIVWAKYQNNPYFCKPQKL